MLCLLLLTVGDGEEVGPAALASSGRTRMCIVMVIEDPPRCGPACAKNSNFHVVDGETRLIS